LSDLGADFLIDRTLARFLWPPEDSAYPRHLHTRRDRGDAAGDVRAIRAELERDIAGLPYDFRAPILLQLPPRVQTLLDELALAKLPSGTGEPQLAAVLRARPQSPRRGDGAIEIVEIGDLQDPFTADAHERVASELADLREHLTWRWIHGPLAHHAHGRRAAELVEAAYAVMPERAWEYTTALCRNRRHIEAGALDRAVRDAPAAERVIAAFESGSFHAPVEHDLHLLDACGVPPIRPAFALGRRLFTGVSAASLLRQEIIRRD
jgi:hypothetical protein